MFLRHGTASANLNSIMVNGLVPRKGNRGNWFKEYQRGSIPDFVYLTNEKTQSDFYALRTACLKKSECLLVITDLDSQNLYPDDNLFQTATYYNKEELEKMQNQVLQNKDLWQDSLKKTNKVCHSGFIDTKKIVDIKTQKKEDNVYFSFIKHRDHDLESFDDSWSVYNAVLDSGFFSDLVDKTQTEFENHERLLRALNIRPNKDFFSYTVECLGKSIMVTK